MRIGKKFLTLFNLPQNRRPFNRGSLKRFLPHLLVPVSVQ